MMRSSRELRLAARGLLAIHVVTALGAIFLLLRTSSAVDQIQRENIYSIEAVEQMTLTLAKSPSLDQAQQARFEGALKRAQENITEEAERPVLDKLQVQWDRLKRGEQPQPRAQIFEQLEALSKINHHSITVANDRAQRLGLAGAWVTVVLALLSFMASTLIVRRTGERLIGPLDEIYQTASAIRRGDRHRRCQQTRTNPEVDEVAQVLNDQLDQIEVLQHKLARPSQDRPTHAHLLPFLDRELEPTALIDHQGKLIAMNKAMLDRVARQDDLKAQLVMAVEADEPPTWLLERRRHGADAWWIKLAPIQAHDTPDQAAQEAPHEAV